MRIVWVASVAGLVVALSLTVVTYTLPEGYDSVWFTALLFVLWPPSIIMDWFFGVYFAYVRWPNLGVLPFLMFFAVLNAITYALVAWCAVRPHRRK